jgi:hypothetical protein
VCLARERDVDGAKFALTGIPRSSSSVDRSRKAREYHQESGK